MSALKLSTSTLGSRLHFYYPSFQLIFAVYLPFIEFCSIIKMIFCILLALNIKGKHILVPKEAQAYSKEVFSKTLTPSVGHVGDMSLRETKEGSKSAIIPCFLSN